MKVKALFLLTNIVAVQGFFGGVTKPKVALNSPEADEAIAFFQKKYPKKEPLTGSDSFSTFGVPKKDIDGSSIQTSTSGSRKRLTDIDEKEGRATFAEMAKVYGAEESLGMIKAMPIVLTFNKDNFAGSLAAWGENFGEEEAKAMVMRNPGLLAIAPKDAANSDDQTMQFSYIIAATRPAGGFLLTTLFLLLLTPLIEQTTQIPIRATLLSGITGQSISDAAQAFQASSDPMGVFSK